MLLNLNIFFIFRSTLHIFMSILFYIAFNTTLSHRKQKNESAIATNYKLLILNNDKTCA